MTLGDKIHAFRELNGYTQRELADKLGVSHAAVGKWEKGIVGNIPLTRLQQIADVLGCDPGYLMGWQTEIKKPIPKDELSTAKRELIKIVESLSEEEVAAVLRLLKR